MIIELLIYTGLNCPVTKTYNLSNLKWDKHDDKILASAKKRCGEKYPEMPCLKYFIKKEDRVYWCVCGARG